MTKKEKHLDSAQKFLVKGQLDRALREYEQAVALDPKDIRVRQKFAELLMRANRKDDAVREFEVIGKYYADNGFYLKAIAVYKQIQRTDPRNLSISLNLASLNEKQGLIGNALAEYKAVYDHYEKTGQLSEGISVLEKMLAADKENVNIRFKLAETRHRAGEKEQAYEDFTGLAQDIKSRGDETAFARVCERIAQLFPERKEFLLTVAEGQVKRGAPLAALPLLKQLVSDDRFNPKALYLLVDAARAAGDFRIVKGAYGQIIKRYPGEVAARSGLISCFIDEGNVDEAFAYLTMFESELRSVEPATVDGLYRALRDLAPQHPRFAETGQRPGIEAGIEAEVAPSPTETTTEESPSSAEPSFLATETEPVFNHADAESEDAAGLQAEDELDITFEEDELPETAPFLGSSVESFAEDETDSLSANAPAMGDEGEDLAGGDAGSFDFPLFMAGNEAAEGRGIDEGDTIELDISHLTTVSDDWLNGAEDAELSPAEETGIGSLDLDFSEGELDDLIPAAPEPAKRDKYGLDGLFSAFKKGVGEQLDQGDTETHYNLGIAYKEMGLYDDAISEFRTASQDPQRRIDCITLQGICCREKGDFLQAEELLQGGVALPGLADEELLCLKYELALLHEAMGACDQALCEYREIHVMSPDFRDTVQKIARLKCDDEALDLADIELVDLDDTDGVTG